MLSNSKVLFLGDNFGGVRPLGGPPNLVKIIVSQTTSYIVSFNFLCQAVQIGHFFGPHFGGETFDVELNGKLGELEFYFRKIPLSKNFGGLGSF